MTKAEKNMEYANWVPKKMIIVPAVLALAFFTLLAVNKWFLLGTVIFTIIAVYFAISHRIFSRKGKNLQEKVQGLILEKLEIPKNKKVRILDIGCGNGPLTIGAAERLPQAELIGVDLWGKNWDYSRQVCQKNAELAGVADRVEFRQASVESLPFEDASFDVVLSNLVFHEVRGSSDKRALVKEALRVLKPGGTFILQDLFLLRAYYGTPQEMLDAIKSWDVSQVVFIRTCDQDFIPGFVKLPFMVGTLAMLYGVK